MIKIKVSNLANGRYDFDFNGKAIDLEIPEPYTGDYHTSVVLDKFENQIIIDVETGITADLTCDRCAADFQSVINSKYKMVYLFQSNFSESEDEKEDIVYLHPDTDKIELDSDVRDFAILAVPMKRLCSENCKGLCPRCGENLNDGSCNCDEKIIDPRWESLQKLKTKNN